MSSILFMKDTPNCSECENVRCKYYGNDFGHIERHPQCPLQDTTELLEEITDKLNELECTGSIKELIPTLNKLHKALGGKENG